MHTGAIVLIAFVASAAGGLVKDRKELCSLKDKEVEKCLANTIQRILPTLVKGLPKYGLFSIDPLHIDLLDLGKDSGKTLDVHHKFMNISMTGLSSAKVTKVSINKKDWILSIENHLTKPLVQTGNYVSQGKLLTFPINGDGKYKITLMNLKSVLTMKGHEEKRGNQSYVKVDKVSFPFTTTQLIVDFENLMKGNKQLSDAINRVLNENWEAVLKDLQGSWENAIGQAFKEIANRIFTKIPINDLIRDFNKQ